MTEQPDSKNSNSLRSLEPVSLTVAVVALVYGFLNDWFHVSIAATVIITLVFLLLVSAYLKFVRGFSFQTIFMVWMGVALVAMLFIVLFPKTMRIEGHVFDRLREPVAGIEVVLHDRRNVPYATRTDNEGAFLFSEVPTGPYSIENPNMSYFSISTSGILIRQQNIDIVADITPIATATIPAPAVEEPSAIEAPPFTPTPSQRPLDTIEPPITEPVDATPTVPASEEENTPEPVKTILSEIDKATLVYIPSGTAFLGARNDDLLAQTDERPQLTTELNGFWIDKYEVANWQFRLCVEAEGCDEPKSTYYYDKSEYDNDPVGYIQWEEAKKYCEWAGRRLLTEAEWEAAARAGTDRIYPWGDDPVDSSKANFCDKSCRYEASQDPSVDDYFVRFAPVIAFPDGDNLYGVRNLSGNIREWVSDWYSSTRSDVSPLRGSERVVKGGSWAQLPTYLRISARKGLAPRADNDFTAYTGIRCGMDYAPESGNQ